MTWNVHKLRVVDAVKSVLSVAPHDIGYCHDAIVLDPPLLAHQGDLRLHVTQTNPLLIRTISC
jgi:hypothetical protein